MNTLYQFTLPIFVKSLNALEKLVEKAETEVAQKGLDEAALVDNRLAPDMFPLKKQIQIVCDNAKGGAARLSGAEAPIHEDTEMTFTELRARIQKTLAYLSTVSEASFEGAETRHITLPYFPGKYLTAMDYTREYVLPNFFFHLTTAYAILRKEGFSIGKGDFLGGLTLNDEV